MNDNAHFDAAAPSRLPPIVVIAEVGDDELGRFGSEASARAGHLRFHLAQLPAYGTHQQRLMHLTAAYRAAVDLGQVCPAAEGEPAQPAARTPAQSYFRTRTGRLTDDACVAQLAALITAVLGEIIDAPLAGTDIESLARGLDLLLGDHGAVPPSIAPLASIDILGPPSDEHAEGRWHRRWVIAHQVHSFFNAGAARAVLHATAHARCGDHERAVDALDHASGYVEAFAPTRALALAVPAAFYNDVLRPTMTPPLTDTPLSGRMHVEYQAYRTALASLLAEIPAPMIELAAESPAFALARERLLEADLLDAERHVTLVAPVVGQAKSIVQTARTESNALSALRSIRSSRAEIIAPFVRFHGKS